MVSIIVPVYKCEKSLEKCVNSLVNQTYTDLEIILVDDGSPDNSGLLCEKLALKDSRIKVIHKKNGGVSSARNAGLKQADGEYLQFVDSDDYVKHTMVESNVERIEYTKSDCVISGRIEISGTMRSKIQVPDIDRVSISEIKKMCPGIFSDYIINSPCNKLYKREYIDFGFDENISLGEDLLFNLKYFEKIKIVSFISECPYFYVKQAGSLTHFYRKNMLDNCAMLYLASKEFIENQRIEESAKKDIANIFMINVIYHLYNTYISLEIDGKEKENKIKYWVANSTVEDAVDICEMKTSYTKCCVWMIKRKYNKGLSFLYFIKKMISQKN